MQPEKTTRIRTTATLGREEAALLWRQNRRWVAAILLAYAPRGVDIDDLLQEVALVVVEKLDTVRDRGKIRPWLRSVAINAARSAGRHAAVRKTTRSLESTDAETADPRAERRHADAESRDEARVILDAARALPADYREPLLLRSVHGLSQKEIAATLELSEAAVESRLARARRMLRERMRHGELKHGERRPIEE